MNYFQKIAKHNFKKLNNFAKTYKCKLSSGSTQRSESKSHLFLLTIPVASFSLGTWQVKRLEWKKRLIQDLQSRTQGEAVELPDNILSSEVQKEMEYRRVVVNGKFDHEQEILLGPRSLNETGKPTTGGLISGRPKIGFHIVTPFVLDNGDRILINRGFVYKDKKKPESRLEGQITDRVQITGHVRVCEKRPRFSPKANENGFNWHYNDVESFSRLLNTSSLLIDADSLSSVAGGPIGGQTRISVRNEHMQYIITWYTLSLATFVMYYQFRKRPGAMFRAGPIAHE